MSYDSTWKMCSRGMTRQVSLTNQSWWVYVSIWITSSLSCHFCWYESEMCQFDLVIECVCSHVVLWVSFCRWVQIPWIHKFPFKDFLSAHPIPLCCIYLLGCNRIGDWEPGDEFTLGILQSVYCTQCKATRNRFLTNCYSLSLSVSYVWEHP